MRVTNSRVTHTAMNRNFSRSVNDVHSKLNKAMNKISSGRAYETAAENPLAYYEGNKLDNQHLELTAQIDLLGDLQHRLEEQENGAYSIQTKLAEAQSRMVFINSSNNSEGDHTVETLRQDFLQKAQFMTNCLNAQYEDYYVFGGNDATTPPFSLSADGKELTFSHKFPGDTTTTVIKMTLQDNGTVTVSDMDNLLRAMKEQGRVDVGYGNIASRETLIDTFTSGLYVLTGLSSDTLSQMSDADATAKIQERLNDSPIFLLGQAAAACEKRLATGDNGAFTDKIGDLIDKTTVTHSLLGTVYSDIGNKWSTLETLETKHKKTSQNLQEQYKDKLGADPYEAITEMYSYQYSYSAALQVGSRLMQSSLFDFIR